MKTGVKDANKFGLWLVTLITVVAFGTLPCFGGGCTAPTPEKRAEITTYVMKRYHVAPAEQLVLVGSAQANDACFWKLDYRAPSLKNDVLLFLSPDGQYLTPNLFDLKIDPIVEERVQAQHTMKALLADRRPTLGTVDAPITIVEFSDYQCPYCKQMTDVLEKGLTVDERKGIRIIFRYYPLPKHPWANAAAEIAGCAAQQNDGVFWKVNDYLFENQKSFTVDNLRGNIDTFAAANVEVNKAQLDKCLDEKLSTSGVAQDVELGTKNGVHSTPTLFINGTKYDGAKDVTQLRAIIADLRKSQQAEVRTIPVR